MVVDEEKLLKYLNNIQDFKGSKAKEYPVDHPYHNVYSAEYVLVKTIIEWIEMGCPDNE